MIAVDTNVVVRFLVNDDKAQARRARALFEREEVFITTTVLLETEWVLRGAYGFAPEQIETFLRGLLGLPVARTERPLQLALALDAYSAGLDFADALHLLAATGADVKPRVFYSFDIRLRRRARKHLPRVQTAAP
ncbi:MAG: type II toxin-antitoxin system VapC family toxin [Burkholderiaceae bacterium]|nr:type II toxin-antitoxin system VapC family toxin [Burkholderiaceae bacterium]